MRLQLQWETSLKLSVHSRAVGILLPMLSYIVHKIYIDVIEFYESIQDIPSNHKMVTEK